MTDTVGLRPETRPVSLFLAVQHGMLRIFKRARCSLLYSLAENFMMVESLRCASRGRFCVDKSVAGILMTLRTC